MEKEIKILMVEDNYSDAELIKYELRKSGLKFVTELVETEKDYTNAIHEFNPDIILSDYSMPQFDGMKALLIREAIVPDIPFILITGSINEETAVSIMKAGADDYIIKENITRLGSAINAAIEKKRIIRHNKQSEEKLKILSRAIEQNPVSIIITSFNGDIEYVNPKFTEITGFSFEEVLGKKPNILKSGVSSNEFYKQLWDTITSGNQWKGEFENHKKNGEIFFESATISPIEDDSGNITHFVAVKEDITERKLVADKLKQSEERFRSLYENASVGIYQTTPEGEILLANPCLVQMLGYASFEELSKVNLSKQGFVTASSRLEFLKAFEQNDVVNGFESVWTKVDGSTINVSESARLFRSANGKPLYFEGMVENITEKKKAEEALKESQLLFQNLAQVSPVGIFRTNPDGYTTYVNPKWMELSGLQNKDSLAYDWLNAVHPDDRKQLLNHWMKDVKGQKSSMAEYRFIKPDGTLTWVMGNAVPEMHDGIIKGYIGTITDITDRKLMEDALRLSEVKYKYLFQNSPLPMWIYDLETLAFIEVNLAAIETYGYSRQEFLNMSLKDIRPAEDVENLLEDINLTFNAYNKAGIWRHVKKDGTLISVEITSHAIDYENRKARLVISADVTDRLKAEKQIKTLSVAIEQSPSAIVITDSDGFIEFVNEKFTAFTQYKLDDVKGKKPRIFNPGHIPDEDFANLMETLKNGNVWVGEVLNRRKDNSRYREELVISGMIKDDGSLGNYILIMNDITEKKNLLLDLIKAKEKAEESDRLKTSFLHNISHEIRTPMNAIVGFSNLINDSNLDHEKRNYFTRIIVDNSNQLLAIITDIITIATIESGYEKVSEASVNINGMLYSLHEQFSLKIQNRPIEFNYSTELSDSDAFVTSDPTKLMGIMSNLLSNALKFTEQGFINFGYRIKGSVLEFYVEDSGIGIAEAMHQEVFKRFRQVELNTARKFGGSGLGLPIAKAYVELLGGKIWVESELQKGSKFYFTIPYSKAFVTNVSSDLIEGRKGLELKSKKTILIAEDEDYNFMLLEELLLNQKLRIIRAFNGAEAVAYCEKNKEIDLVLMDIKMPGMGGLDATKEIRKFNKITPIIAQTAHALTGDREIAIESGCNDYLVKPIRQADLIGMIEKYLFKTEP